MSSHRWQRIAPSPRVVRPVAVDPTGMAGPTRGQAAGPRWRRASPGRYVPADVDADLPEQRVVEQGLRLPPGAAVTGWASLRLHGAQLSDGFEADGQTRRPVPVIVGPRGGLANDPAWTVSFEHIAPWETQRLWGVTVTRPERAAFDAMRAATCLEDAVVVADVACAAEITSLDRLRRFTDGHRSMRRSRSARAALTLADEHSWSPPETRLRLLLSGSGDCSRLLTNAEIMVGEARIGFVDLLAEDAGVVVEYDGADHRGPTRQAFDITKEDLLRRAGLEVVRVSSLHLSRPDLVLQRFGAARARATAASKSGGRRWWVRPRIQSLDDILSEREVTGWLATSFEDDATQHDTEQ